ncbi:MAG: hypothetical protein BAJALOKI1v1_1690004 [Promethearchaeota archaeon]|nr:MAG: hypothetical protein BAJALOKI1v1_1690004 [Candidatus Lokiarchaeota archaeon]
MLVGGLGSIPNKLAIIEVWIEVYPEFDSAYGPIYRIPALHTGGVG